MARLPRLDLPGIPQHIVQRGNDRQPCFADAADYLHYRQELREAALKHGCAVHAYVLMTNHVHLLVTPDSPGGASRMMQAIGRRYVGAFNARYRRTGTLWEGRFKSALVDGETYLLTCHRYIELNPVRAGMVARPEDYRWSSHRCNALGEPDVGLTPHPRYLSLGTDAGTRQGAYRALFLTMPWSKPMPMPSVTTPARTRPWATTASAAESKPSSAAAWRSAHAADLD